MSADLWDATAVAVKSALYAATLGAAGGTFFLAYGHALLAEADRTALRRFVGALLIGSLLLGGVRLLVTAASMSADASGMFDAALIGMAWQGEGAALMARTASLVAALPALLSRRRPGLWALSAAGGAAVSFAWIGHTHTHAGHWAPLVLGVHLLGAAFWLGALGPLLLLARGADPRRVAAPAQRFGRIAAAALLLLAAAGLALLLAMLGGALSGWLSPYGRCLCAKLALIGCLLGVAAYNKLHLTPRLLKGDARALRSLRRSLLAELLLAAGILTATAALSTRWGPPAHP